MINFDYLSNYQNIKIRSIKREIDSYDIEVINNAKLIKEISSKKIIVALSGGIDSEVVCLAFLKSNIDFETLTVQYTDNKNAYDCYFAKKFCQENNIKQHIITVNPENFYTDIISKYQKQNVFAHSIYRYLQIYLLDISNQLNGIGICCAGEQLFYTFDNIINVKYEPLHIPLNWLRENNILGVPSFYLFSPEIQAAYYKDPLIKFLLGDSKYFVSHPPLGFSAEKILLFHKFFNLVRRKKMIGYEEIIPLKNRLETTLKQFYDNSSYFYKPVSEVINELGL